MKKNLFRKFLALFLTGTMLAGVGCKDYDDDIDKINNRLDELTTGQIATMEQQISSMQTTVGNLQAADTRLEGLINELKSDVTADAAKIAALETAKKQLEDRIKAIEGNYVTKDFLTTTLGSYATVASVADAVKLAQGLKKYVTDKAIDDAIEAAKQAAITAAGNALEEAFTTKLAAYYTSSQVDSAIQKEIEAYDEKIKTYISEAVNEGGFINEKIAGMISDAVGDLKAKVEKLEKDVAALAAQIQSLVYVPEYADGTAEMKYYAFNGEEAGSGVVLKFRVSPAKMAAEMATLYEAGALSLVTEEVKTRAAAPAAVITGVEVVDAAAGTFAVSAQIANYPAANTAVAVALAVKAAVNENANVSNDVVSNFAGVLKAQAPITLEFALFDAEGNKYANEDIEVVWNTKKADSKREILKGLELQVSIDGGTKYMPLADASAKIGAAIVADKYTTTSNPASTDANFTIVNVDDKAWGSAYASAQFKADGTNALVGNNVKFDYSIKAKFAGNAAAEAVSGTVYYKPVNETGATLAFAKLSKDWTYDFVKTGIGADTGADTAMPVIDADKFGEIALTVEAGSIPAGVKLSDIMGVVPAKSIKVDGQDASSEADFNFAAFANDIAQGVKVDVPMKKYAWGKTYDIAYTYSYQNVDYVLKGSIAFGKAPAEVKYEYPAVEIAYEDKAITGAWKTVYDAWKAAGNAGFASDTEFAAAIFAGTNAPVVAPETKLFNETNPDGLTVNDSNGTAMVANASTLTGDLKKADITANGDKFVQTATWMTWYGQKVTVTMTYNVKLPTYVLTANDTWVNADGIVGTKGEVDTTSEKWSVKLNGAVKDYFYFSPASNMIEKQYIQKSVDGTPAGSVYAEVGGMATEPTVTWVNGTTTEKDIVMTAKLILDSKVTVASKDFTIHADDPIKTFAQAAAQEAQYVPNGKLEVDLLKGISLVDINGTAWINANGEIKKTSVNSYGPEVVFGMTGGSAATAGIVFDAAKMTNTGNLSLTINDNKLEYTNDGSVMQKDVTVTIPAKITYWLGEKDAVITVVIKK